MPTKLTNATQQDVVADFIYEKDLELCMFVYLDEFLNIHQQRFPQDATAYGTQGIRALLEASYERIRRQIQAGGLLTEKAASKYLMSRKK
jgi:hypothetical protein